MINNFFYACIFMVNRQSKCTFGKVTATKHYDFRGNVVFLEVFMDFSAERALKSTKNDLKKASESVRSYLSVFRT